METELSDTLATLQEQLDSIQGVLLEDPLNEEALQLKAQLEEALQLAQSALQDIQEGDAQGQVDAGGHTVSPAGNGHVPPHQYDSTEMQHIQAAVAKAEAGAREYDMRDSGRVAGTTSGTAAEARAQDLIMSQQRNKRAAQESPAPSTSQPGVGAVAGGWGRDAGVDQEVQGHQGHTSRQGPSPAHTASAARAAAALGRGGHHEDVEEGDECDSGYTGGAMQAEDREGEAEVTQQHRPGQQPARQRLRAVRGSAVNGEPAARPAGPEPWHAGRAQRPGAGTPAAAGYNSNNNNARIHPASQYYREEPDFVSLAARFPELKPYLTLPTAPGGRAVFDYTSWEGTRQLTATLLKADFGITWWLPEGQLVPTVTNRANYIHWINDLLALSAPQRASPAVPHCGLDIGCGANFIYCLLGAALYGWRMVGVDVTEVALEWAQRHIDNNPQLAGLLELRRSRAKVAVVEEAYTGRGRGRGRGRGGRGGRGGSKSRRGSRREEDDAAEQAPVNDEVPAAEAAEGNVAPGESVVESTPGQVVDAMQEGGSDAEDVGGILTPALQDDVELFAFTMCNPPFFESMEEANQNPNTACGGTAAEMVYPGGELAFILRMLEDSVRLGGRVHWYTTMVGKKSTLKVLRKELHARHVTAIRTTEFAQGRTSRWGIAWSFAVDPNLATVPLPRPQGPQVAARALIPSRTSAFQIKALGVDGRKLLSNLQSVLSAHGASCQVDSALWRVTAQFPGQATTTAPSQPPAGAAPGPASAAANATRPGAGVTGGDEGPAVGSPQGLQSDSGAAGDAGQAAGEHTYKRLRGSSVGTSAGQALAVVAGAVSSQGPQPAPSGGNGGHAAVAGGQGAAASSQGAAAVPAVAAAPAGASTGSGAGSAPAQQHPGAGAMASKQAPVGAGAGAAAAEPVVGGTTAGPLLNVRLNVFQQQRGVYEVTATIPNTAGLAEATRFVQLMQRVKGDLEAVCCGA